MVNEYSKTEIETTAEPVETIDRYAQLRGGSPTYKTTVGSGTLESMKAYDQNGNVTVEIKNEESGYNVYRNGNLAEKSIDAERFYEIKSELESKADRNFRDGVDVTSITVRSVPPVKIPQEEIEEATAGIRNANKEMNSTSPENRAKATAIKADKATRTL